MHIICGLLYSENIKQILRSAAVAAVVAAAVQVKARRGAGQSVVVTT